MPSKLTQNSGKGFNIFDILHKLSEIKYVFHVLDLNQKI